MGILNPPVTASRVRQLSGNGRRFALLGDSMTYANRTVISGSLNARNTGYFWWTRAALGGRIDHRWEDNFGVSGDTTIGMLTRVPQIVAGGYDWCVVLAGTNDIELISATPTDIIARLTSIYDTLRAAGTQVVCCTIIPRASSGTTWTATNAKSTRARVNQFIRNYCDSNRGAILADTDAAFLISGGSDGTTALYYDGLHPGAAGAKLIGDAIAAAVAPYLAGSHDLLFADAADIYGTTINPTGNLIDAGGLMPGTAGVLADAVLMSGPVATGWVARRISSYTTNGGTMVCSKEARATGGEWQVFTIANLTSATPGSYYVNLDRIVDYGTGRYQPGDVIEASAEFSLTAGFTFITHVSLDITDQNGTDAVTYTDGGAGTTQTLLPAGALSGVLRVPRFTVRPHVGGGAKRLTISMSLGFYSGSPGGSGEVKFGRVALRKVL